MSMPQHRSFSSQEAGKRRAAPAPGRLEIAPLAQADREEALGFLGAGALDSIYMAGLIADNGLVSPANRGTFYGARDHGGRLVGAALIGHFMCARTEDDEALAAFARLAQERHVHVLVGDPEKIERFWRHYGRGGQQPRLICRELFFERRAPVEVSEPVPALRLATTADLFQIAQVNASMIRAESGVNPLDGDATGFRARISQRIAKGRVWVLTKKGRLVFKAEVIADTPPAAYVEGVFVHPEERGKGVGRRCMTQLASLLLERSESVCGVVNEQNRDAQVFFFKTGFKLRGLYDSIYLAPKSDGARAAR
jgi:predicted GNAT family acetyltransferase